MLASKKDEPRTRAGSCTRTTWRPARLKPSSHASKPCCLRRSSQASTHASGCATATQGGCASLQLVDEELKVLVHGLAADWPTFDVRRLVVPGMVYLRAETCFWDA